MKRALIAVGAFAGAVAIAAPVIAAPPGTENFNKSSETAAEGCGDGNSLVITAPSKLWPPNHKYYEDIDATANDEDGGVINLTTSGTHDQYGEDTEMNGSGNTGDDITVDENETAVRNEDESGTFTPVYDEAGTSTVTTDWRARAERSGRELDGRTYTLTAIAEFDDGTCSVEVSFDVPHDMRPSNRNDGVPTDGSDAPGSKGKGNNK